MEKGNRRGPDSGRIAEFALAADVILLGVIVLWETRDIRITPMNSRIGPRVIPYIVGAGLVVVGIWLAIELAFGRTAQPSGGEDAEDADPTLPTDWQTLGFIAAALVLYLILIERAGFVIASSVLFLGAAFAMGSRRWLRDVCVAVILSVSVYLIFTRGLSLRLPKGVLPLEFIAGWA